MEVTAAWSVPEKKRGGGKVREVSRVCLHARVRVCVIACQESQARFENLKFTHKAHGLRFLQENARISFRGLMDALAAVDV